MKTFSFQSHCMQASFVPRHRLRCFNHTRNGPEAGVTRCFQGIFSLAKGSAGVKEFSKRCSVRSGASGICPYHTVQGNPFSTKPRSPEHMMRRENQPSNRFAPWCSTQYGFLEPKPRPVQAAFS
jgi:hypothetical protein